MRLRGIRFAAMIGAGVLAMTAWGIATAVNAHAQAADSTAAAKAPATGFHVFVGVKKCKMCHNAAAGGAQYTKWTESKHSKAYEALASDKAKEIATKKGIADAQKAPECLQCHQTGFGEPADHFAANFVATDGVQCESCHGAGKDYVSKKTMQGIRDGSLKAKDYGLVMPTKETCIQCHNEKSPSYKPFDFKDDSTKIAHPIPPGYKRGGTEDATEAK
jgi:Cytochrome c554 and c-prime